MDSLVVREIFKKFHSIEPERISILRNEGRLIAEIRVDSHSYFLKGEKHSFDYVQDILSFAAELKEGGIPFPTFEETLTGQRFIEAHNMIFTLEKKMEGFEVEQLQLVHIIEIGKLLGRAHARSLEATIHFETGTSWGMFGGNQSDVLGEYDENELSFQAFYCAAEGFKEFAEEVQQIKECYETKRRRLCNKWNTLPMGPVQGDFCPYNMLFAENGSITSIYDFNIAGQEVLLNECIGVGVFLGWHTPYVGNDTEGERFQAFLNAYRLERPLSQMEDNVLNDLFAIIRAFRYDRVAHLSKMDHPNKVGPFLSETLEILNGCSGME